jgi:hypothetical protein
VFVMFHFLRGGLYSMGRVFFFFFLFGGLFFGVPSFTEKSPKWSVFFF